MCSKWHFDDQASVRRAVVIEVESLEKNRSYQALEIGQQLCFIVWLAEAHLPDSQHGAVPPGRQEEIDLNLA